MSRRTRYLVAAALFVTAACGGGAHPAGAPAPVATRAAAPAAAPHPDAVAHLRGVNGEPVGEVILTQTPSGVLVAGTVFDLGLGEHAIHIHAVGSCVPPFTSAGGHYNPQGHHHGLLNPDGHHMGDMTDLVTPAAGRYSFQQFVDGARLQGGDGILDADGSAIVIHAGRDDYTTDPSGNSGGRIACGVITAR